MIYTLEEKLKLDNILRAFSSYIQANNYFDILYSDRIGYVRMVIDPDEEEEAIRIESAAHLLDVLFNEIINDIVFAPENDHGEHFDSKLSPQEEKESRCRIAFYLENIGEEKENYLSLMDRYLLEYPDYRL